jgi:class I fructose-bisphosphate aldolase
MADPVRLGADVAGYTLYVGSPAQERDFGQYRQIREDAQRSGLPLIVGSYPQLPVSGQA